MKTIMKCGLLLSLLFFVLGLGSLIASVALGATWYQFIDAVDHGEFSFPSNGRLLRRFHSTENVPAADSHSYSEVEYLDVKLSKGILEIVETDEDELSVEVTSDPSNAIHTNLEQGTLKISSDSKTVRDNVEIQILIPEEDYFEKVNLDIGAAIVTIPDLETNELEVKLGTGTFTGTGEIESEKSNWQIGVGELSLAYLDCADIAIDCGMGTVSAALSDCQEDYDWDITCGAGAVDIGNNNFSLGHHSYSGDNADRQLQVNCGMGTVDLIFEDE